MHGKTPVILNVDDVKTNLLILRAILGKEGFDVIEASNCIICRQLANAQNPDLILLDIMMPEENGFETCKKLKANPSTMEIPVIFVSALSEAENKIQGFSIGAVDYVIKPNYHTEIITRVKLHLRLSMMSFPLVNVRFVYCAFVYTILI